METVLGFSLIGLFIFVVFFLGRKFFKKKKILHDHDQEMEDTLKRFVSDSPEE